MLLIRFMADRISLFAELFLTNDRRLGRESRLGCTRCAGNYLPEGRVPISRGSASPHRLARVYERHVGGSVQGRYVFASVAKSRMQFWDDCRASS